MTDGHAVQRVQDLLVHGHYQIVLSKPGRLKLPRPVTAATVAVTGQHRTGTRVDLLPELPVTDARTGDLDLRPTESPSQRARRMSTRAIGPDDLSGVASAT